MTTTRRFPDLVAFEQTLAGMLADPEVTGDLLLVGLCMARRVYFGEWRDGKVSTADMARAIFGHGPPATLAAAWRVAMRTDIRRYDYRADPRNASSSMYRSLCNAPMIRREGACGQGASQRHLLTDVDNGGRYWCSGCSRHSAWLEEQYRTNRAAVEALGDLRPVPAANVGGALRRHLPSFRWADYWRTLDERWREPPETTPFTPPTLALILTDDFEPDPTVPRPVLTLIEGEHHA